jgi:hypothetical protein
VRFDPESIPEETDIDRSPTKQRISSASRIISSSPPIPIPRGSGNWGKRYFGVEEDVAATRTVGSQDESSSAALLDNSFHSAQSSLTLSDHGEERGGLRGILSLSRSQNAEDRDKSQDHAGAGGGGGSRGEREEDLEGVEEGGNPVTTMTTVGSGGSRREAGAVERRRGSLLGSTTREIQEQFEKVLAQCDGARVHDSASEESSSGMWVPSESLTGKLANDPSSSSISSQHRKRSPRVSWGDTESKSIGSDSTYPSDASSPARGAARDKFHYSHGGGAVGGAANSNKDVTGISSVESGSSMPLSSFDSGPLRLSAAAVAARVDHKGPISRVASSDADVGGWGAAGSGTAAGNGSVGGAIDGNAPGSFSRVSSWSTKFSPSRIVTYISNLPLNIRGRAEAWETNRGEIEMLEQIGKGQTGVVHRCKWRRLQCAAKILTVSGKNTIEYRDMVNEISTVSHLRHPNLVLFLGACTQEDGPLLLLNEFMAGGSLEQRYSRKRRELCHPWRPPRQLVAKWIRELTTAVHFLHKCVPPIIHRDLKPANILLTEEDVLKIADFGLSKVLRHSQEALPANYKMTGEAGTKRYMAPEVVRCEPYYDEKVRQEL